MHRVNDLIQEYEPRNILMERKKEGSTDGRILGELDGVMWRVGLENIG
jgi:hypothetical protein